MTASHDDALPLLRALAQTKHKLHLDIQFSGSVDALAALNDGRCLMAGFHALTESPLRSPTAQGLPADAQAGAPQAGELRAAHAGADRGAGQPAGHHDAGRPVPQPACASRTARAAPARASCWKNCWPQQQIAPERIGGFESDRAVAPRGRRGGGQRQRRRQLRHRGGGARARAGLRAAGARAVLPRHAAAQRSTSRRCRRCWRCSAARPGARSSMRMPGLCRRSAAARCCRCAACCPGGATASPSAPRRSAPRAACARPGRC